VDEETTRSPGDSTLRRTLVPWRQVIGPGGAYAIVLLVVIRLVMDCVVFPHPPAREILRHKTRMLTAGSRPDVIIAGDSRALRHVDPEALAHEMGLAVDRVVNVAGSGCGPACALANFREFAEDFGERPVMILSVSFYAVNDNAQLVEDELLWSLGWSQRRQLTSLPDSLLSVFLPERTLGKRLWRRCFAQRPAAECEQRGFEALPISKQLRSDPAEEHRRLQRLTERWYGDPQIDGVRWRRLEADLLILKDLDVQVVLLNSPLLPQLLEHPEGTHIARWEAAMHFKLTALSRKMDIPYYRYTAALFGDRDPAEVFSDEHHLNRVGASILTRRLGADLRTLVAQQRLRLEPPRYASLSVSR